ncbi:TPA: 4Fe-4S binding protein [Methanosarcinaceae archaeon]|nr:4Fe-4S binding protein [Methanosarcinaceae archaeon]
MKESTRMLVPEEKKCIGCRACTSACPEKLITFSEEGKLRSISFPANCSPDCELCALACPEKAISFTFPEEEEKSRVPLETQTLDFELAPCQKCGTAFATRRELEKVRTAISEKFPFPQQEASGWNSAPAVVRQRSEKSKQKQLFRQESFKKIEKARQYQL